MQITKFGHSCLLVEEGNARILIDPGSWTTTQNDVRDLDAILITHEHYDHCDPGSIKLILTNNPSAVIFTNQGVARKLAVVNIPSQLLEDGQMTEIKNVKIEAFGRDHAIIYSTFPHFDNTGYLIAERLFHPGDSFAVIPSKPVELLALPVVAPWCKMSEVIDYARAVKPKVCFPIHDAMALPGVFDKHPKNILPTFGIDVTILDPGQTVVL